jgi:hypothetical protein
LRTGNWKKGFRGGREREQTNKRFSRPCHSLRHCFPSAPCHVALFGLRPGYTTRVSTRESACVAAHLDQGATCSRVTSMSWPFSSFDGFKNQRDIQFGGNLNESEGEACIMVNLRRRPVLVVQRTNVTDSNKLRRDSGCCRTRPFRD